MPGFRINRVGVKPIMLINIFSVMDVRMGRVMVFLLAFLCLFGFCSQLASAQLLPFEKDRQLYVSMWNTDDYNIFSKNGRALGSITAPGLKGPRGIAFNPDNGNIWVAGELSNTIYIFDRQHRFRWKLNHPEFNQPVGVTFRPAKGPNQKITEVYISNSGTDEQSTGNNIMVFNLDGVLLRKVTRNGLVDPNCLAFFPDGSYYVANRLGRVDAAGIVDGGIGRVDKFDKSDNFLFSFRVPGMTSTMAIARDPNGKSNRDDTLWVTSGGGDRAIYEFSQNGELLKTIAPKDLPSFGVSGSAMVPQGIAFDSKGNMTVASWLGGIYQFDGDGRLLNSYDSDPRLVSTPGKARSIAFRPARILERTRVNRGNKKGDLKDKHRIEK